MRASLSLALAHARFRWARTATLAVAVALIALTPVATRLVLNAAETALRARAAATPYIVGARGGALDLVLNGLYFTDARPPATEMATAEAIWESGLADAYPLHVRFRVAAQPVVGVTVDYFAFRGLQLAEGRGLAVLGDAVLGAAAAAALGAGPGDRVTTAPETLFDLAGAYPLRMTVAGVLAPTGGPDDQAVFVDLGTAWIMEGIGHGHDADGDDPLAPVEAFTEVTPDNLESFHFHGDPARFPISLVIAAPHDARSAAILRGRHLDPQGPTQIVAPAAVIDALLDQVFRVGRVLDAAAVAMAGGAALAIALALRLATRMRAAEFAALARIGCKKFMVAELVIADLVIVLSLAASILITSTAMFIPFAHEVALRLIAG